MKRTRTYYEKRFANYPDLVDLITFRQMLGGIGDTALPGDRQKIAEYADLHKKPSFLLWGTLK